MALNRADLDAAMAQRLAEAPGADAAFEALWRAADVGGDVAGGWLASAGGLLAIAADFSDFRGLAAALQRFDAGPGPGADAAPWREIDRIRLDAARIARPMLDHAADPDAAPVRAAEERLLRALQQAPAFGGPIGPDERVLLAKVLVDALSLRNDGLGIERVAAFMHEHVARGGVSPAWQGQWWLLMARNHQYWSHAAAADEALEQARVIAEAHALPTLRHELACVDLNTALRFEDLPRAERLSDEIDRLRPQVRAGRVPYGLRAQAALLIRRGEYRAALARLDLLLALCDDVAVPQRDRGTYHVQRCHCLTALGEHAAAIEGLQALAPHQSGGQADVLRALLALARAAAALGDDERPSPAARRQVAEALQRCARIDYDRFFLPLPRLAARIAAIGWDDGVEREFVAAAIRGRRLEPPDGPREHWPWRLKVRVLGDLELLRDDAALPGMATRPPRRPLEVLAVLAAHGHRPVRMEALIELLWPSLDAEAPRAALDMALSRLRKLLDVPEAILVADGLARLNPALVWCDVAAFEHAAGRAVGAAGAESVPGVRLPPDTEEAGDAAALADPASARAALSLYRGPLLGRTAVSGAMQALRERLAARLCELTLRLGHTHEARREWEAAGALYARGVALDPLAEAVHRALMRVQLAQGEHAEALRSYARCRDALHATLGLEPSPATQALRDQARRG